MQKKDLKYGNVVEFKNDERGIICGSLQDSKKVILRLNESEIFCSYLHLISYDDDLKINENPCYDIMKVYKDYTCRKLLWERPKEPLLTEEEKEYLKAIIKPFPKSIKRIVKLKQHGRLIISLYDGYISLGILDETQFHFDRLENEEDYTLKELGLED